MSAGRLAVSAQKHGDVSGVRPSIFPNMLLIFDKLFYVLPALKSVGPLTDICKPRLPSWLAV